MIETNPSALSAAPGPMRLLKCNEVVRRGDFVALANAGFEPWVGPSGFRADTFVKQIYRLKNPPVQTKGPH